MTKRVSLVLLRFSLGLFFIVLGLAGVLPSVDESIFSFPNSYRTLELVFGLAELACGLFILAGVFVRIKQNTTFFATLVVIGVWLARIVLTRFVWGLAINDAGILFRPTFFIWVIVLSVELVVASALQLLMRAYDR